MKSRYQMISNKHDPFREMSLNPPIGSPLDLIFDTFISTDNNRSRCEPSVSISSHEFCIPLGDCGDRNSETLLCIRDVPNIRPLLQRVLRIKHVLVI